MDPSACTLRGPPTEMPVQAPASCQTAVMHGSWRRWLPGPKHGIARSVGVFGTPGSGGPEQFFELLARCTRLRAWASSHGVTLADDPVSLPVLDRHLDAWNAQPPTHPFLEPEIGCCVGTVIVRHVPGSRWRVLAQRSPGSATTIRR